MLSVSSSMLCSVESYNSDFFTALLSCAISQYIHNNSEYTMGQLKNSKTNNGVLLNVVKYLAINESQYLFSLWQFFHFPYKF
jgi:hypothetical protein